MTTGELSELLQKLDLASSDPKHEVRIIFQTREVSDEKRKPHKSTNVFEIDSSIPYARLFQKVAAVIHWGEPDVLAEALAAGKPVGTCGIHSSQQFWASVCEQAQVGLPLINWRKCTVDSLTSSFLELLKPGLGVNAQKVATTFDPEKAINAAVNAFTANLPMEAMRCDVDRANLARVFDTCHDLKLSLEAYLAVQPRRDESKGFVPYKPLRFGGSRPPRFSISGNPGETPPDSKPARLLDGVALTMDVLDLQASERISTCTSSSASDTGSINAHPSNIALYWASAEEEVAVRTTTNAAYERLVKRPKRTSKLDTVKRMFGVGKQARRREELQYLTVQ
ncbi:hypothetical protein PHYBOEH_010748 [Phytophthora boehmeriae]|uniref:Uncharacterized protein n=1 Tax=Phytophthora boehmeriae TaxID=109152 RepID=A0A8T1X3H6_9STRA|nr:hypothetical protein PHYBOEH_010748 [Phytophthora boehmeriae]